jgi:hypothetical protein
MRFILTLTLLLPTLLFAQQPNMYLHIGPSVVSYKGDMGDFEKLNAAFHIGLQLNKKKRVNGNFNIGFGEISDDFTPSSLANVAGAPAPNDYFKTKLFYLNYDLHINIIKKEKWIVYLSQGIGFVRFTPKNGLGENLQDNTQTRAAGEDYRNSAVMLPTSLGVIYFLPNNFGIGFQSGFYNTSTDYLDNISEFGSSGNDNILAFRLALYAPLNF